MGFLHEMGTGSRKPGRTERRGSSQQTGTSASSIAAPSTGGPRGGLASWTRMGDNVSYCDCIALTAFSPFSKLRPHHRCWLDGCCRVPQRSAPHTFSHASVDRRPPTEIETISPAPNSSSCFHEFSTRFDRTSSLLFSLRGKLVQDSVLTPEAPDPRTT